MKKIYQNPKITIIKIQTTQIMAGSLRYGNSTEATSGNLSREGGSFFDDSDDEWQYSDYSFSQ